MHVDVILKKKLIECAEKNQDTRKCERLFNDNYAWTTDW